MRSDAVKKGFERAPHRSLLKATGVTEADMGKPFIAVCNSFVEIVPGQRRLDLLVPEAELAERRGKWQLPPKEKPAGSLGKNASMATSASTGAILKG